MALFSTYITDDAKDESLNGPLGTSMFIAPSPSTMALRRNVLGRTLSSMEVLLATGPSTPLIHLSANCLWPSPKKYSDAFSVVVTSAPQEGRTMFSRTPSPASLPVGTTDDTDPTLAASENPKSPRALLASPEPKPPSQPMNSVL